MIKYHRIWSAPVALLLTAKKTPMEITNGHENQKYCARCNLCNCQLPKKSTQSVKRLAVLRSCSL